MGNHRYSCSTSKRIWLEYEQHCHLHMCCVQASEAETKKYEEAQQSEQSAFQASIVDLDQAVASMQSYTDMSAATAVAQEVTSLSTGVEEKEKEKTTPFGVNSIQVLYRAAHRCTSSCTRLVSYLSQTYGRSLCCIGMLPSRHLAHFTSLIRG